MNMNIVVIVVIVGVGLWSVRGGAQQAPCYFIFGDSSADSGNNNNLWSYAKADYLPYGIDFIFGPTGRFSNGKTTVDIIAERLGFSSYIAPFSRASDRDIFSGVNYASAGAGISDETGQHLGGRTSFRGQVQNHIRTVSYMLNLLRDANRTEVYLKRCIYSIGIGSEDYLSNYFLTQLYRTGTQYPPDRFADLLTQQYAQFLRVLYNYGARKMVLFGVAPIGCSPYALAQNSPDGRTCVETLNSPIQLFNSRVRSMVDQLNSQLPNARFTYINVYGIFQDMISNPSSFGFRVVNAGCCRVGRNSGRVTCLPLQQPCSNRNEVMYFDAYNPSEAANTIIARRAYNAQSSSDAYPVDISTLNRS
ncbi:GDSL esterase/lipase At5g45670 [Vigna radiata var. radiata]|uniref:GDSL esterase/lipase At5g45670 n=1 Tax=Vigna radiata var. radiata TaxID=3916 RepID=A0A3Q0FG69_VIGRR|nr:GDSL esterase/lipase At5g45670 [Vigna radiata var. radiata]